LQGRQLAQRNNDLCFFAPEFGEFFPATEIGENHGNYTSGKTFSKVLPFVHDGGPWGTVPELLFEKKGLIPAVQQLLVSHLWLQARE
jgi:hypothetical protein